MKYKIVSFRSTDEPRIIPVKLRLRGRNTLRVYSAPTLAPIGYSELFAFGYLYEPYSEICPPSLSRRAALKFRRFMARVNESMGRIAARAKSTALKVEEKIRQKRARRAALPSLLPAFLGALCAALAVAAISATAVIYRLFVADYFGFYENVTVPDLVGHSYPTDAAFSDIDYCNITVKYEYDSDIPEGTVISQTPSAGVVRRVYSHKSLCNVSLTVSLGEKFLTMNDYSSLSLRDAMLELKNEAVKVKVEESYSDTVEAGRIISTSPAVGETFSCDGTVILNVSLGPETVYVTVPSVTGLNEIRAEAMLKAAGLTVGSITYVSSEANAGIVIAQSHAAYSSAEEGSAVSLTISAGIKYNEKTMPDLYGLSIDAAKAKLAEFGLVCGNIYAVANGAPGGTVIAQSILPGAPIDAGTVSVDIYVSS